jgi:hypothetical protein
VHELLKIAPEEISHTNSQGQTALHVACMQENIELVKTLLAHEPNIEQRDNGGRTALALAAAYGQSEALRLLLKKGADPNTRDSYGLSALERALFGGHFDATKMLLEAGAQITTPELKRQLGSIDTLLRGRTGVRATAEQRAEIFKTVALLVRSLTHNISEAESFLENDLKLTPALQKQIMKEYR